MLPKGLIYVLVLFQYDYNKFSKTWLGHNDGFLINVFTYIVLSSVQ